MQQELYYVRRGPTLQYGPRIPEDVMDTDQVFSLRGETNDERLVRLGYVAAVSSRSSIVSCGLCGAKFISDASLTVHGRRRHAGQRDSFISDARPMSASNLKQIAVPASVTAQINAQEDQAIEREEKRVDAERPLYWEKTAAAQKAGDAPTPEVSTKPARRRRTSKRRES